MQLLPAKRTHRRNLLHQRSFKKEQKTGFSNRQKNERPKRRDKQKEENIEQRGERDTKEEQKTLIKYRNRKMNEEQSN